MKISWWLSLLLVPYTAVILSGCVPQYHPGDIIQTPEVDPYAALNAEQRQQVALFNVDVLKLDLPPMSAQDAAALEPRDIARLRMAIRYRVSGEILDGRVHMVQQGKVQRKVEE